MFHKEGHGNIESTTLSRDSLSREIGRSRKSPGPAQAMSHAPDRFATDGYVQVLLGCEYTIIYYNIL